MSYSILTQERPAPRSILYNPAIDRALVLLALALTVAAAVSAGPILQVRYDGFDPEPGAIFGRSVIDPADNQRVTTNAMSGGRFEMTLMNAGAWEGGFEGGSTFYTFCIEPREFVTLGATHSYELVPLEQGTSNIGGMGAVKAGLLRELFGRYLPDLRQSLSVLEAGALQIAIWEIVREDSGTHDVLTGDIYFFSNGSTNPAGTLSRAQEMLSALDGTGPKLGNLVALRAYGGVQDVLAQVETPEPGTFAMAGFALLGLSFALRRRRMLPSRV